MVSSVVRPPIFRPDFCAAIWSRPLTDFRLTTTSGVTMRSLIMPQQIAAAARDGSVLAAGLRLLNQSERVRKIPRVGVGEGFHASAPMILSLVIGRSFMRLPIALKTALPTAATAGTLLDSPMLFAP